MLRRLLPCLAAAVLGLASSASAQCSTLAVDSTLDPSGIFQTVTIDVTGSARNALHVLVVGETPGTTTVTVRGTSLDLGLATPFKVAPIGTSDASGDLSLSLKLPPDLNLILYAQSVGVELTLAGGAPSLSLCESNVDDVQL